MAPGEFVLYSSSTQRLSPLLSLQLTFCRLLLGTGHRDSNYTTQLAPPHIIFVVNLTLSSKHEPY